MANKGSPVALITGGTTGIGGATARELARRGYALLLVALADPGNLVAQLRETHVAVDFLSADLINSEQVARESIAHAIALYGQLDLLVNCAGTISHKDPVLITEQDWDRIFAINLKSPFFFMQQALPHLISSKGSIVNVSSTNAVKPMAGNQLYDSLKAALNNLTQGFSLQYRSSGVRVNAIMPGGVRTPLTEGWLETFLGRETTEDDFNIPSIGKPEQIAKVIAALASDEFSWVNGVTLPVDGGYGLG